MPIGIQIRTEKKRDRRFSVALTLLKEVRLSLFGLASGVSKTGMAEQIVNRAVSNELNWREIQNELRQEVALRNIPVEQLIRDRHRADGFDRVIDLDAIDLGILLDEEETEEEEPPESL